MQRIPKSLAQVNPLHADYPMAKQLVEAGYAVTTVRAEENFYRKAVKAASHDLDTVALRMQDGDGSRTHVYLGNGDQASRLVAIELDQAPVVAIANDPTASKIDRIMSAAARLGSIVHVELQKLVEAELATGRALTVLSGPKGRKVIIGRLPASIEHLYGVGRESKLGDVTDLVCCGSGVRVRDRNLVRVETSTRAPRMVPETELDEWSFELLEALGLISAEVARAA